MFSKKARDSKAPQYRRICQAEGGCFNTARHTCESCTKVFCSEHEVEMEDEGVWYCGPCFIKEMDRRGFDVEFEGGSFRLLERLPPQIKETSEHTYKGPVRYSPGSPTETIEVRPKNQFLKVRRITQPKVLTGGGVYILEGGGILETPHGDVCLTKEQLAFLYEELSY